MGFECDRAARLGWRILAVADGELPDVFTDEDELPDRGTAEP